jgi:hypothetical protein
MPGGAKNGSGHAALTQADTNILKAMMLHAAQSLTAFESKT